LADRPWNRKAGLRGQPDSGEKYAALVGLLVLAVGLGNLGRAWIAWQYSTQLPQLAMTASWTYLVLMGVVWGMALVVVSVGLLRFRTWGRAGTLVASSLYQANVWTNHVLFDANGYVRQTWPRELLLTGLFLAAVWGVLCWPRMRQVFRP
jgi:hypothetical protein